MLKNMFLLVELYFVQFGSNNKKKKKEGDLNEEKGITFSIRSKTSWLSTNSM